MLIDDLDLSVRANFLRCIKSGYETAGEIIKLNINGLKQIKGIGRKALQEIKTKLELYGIHLYEE